MKKLVKQYPSNNWSKQSFASCNRTQNPSRGYQVYEYFLCVTNCTYQNVIFFLQLLTLRFEFFLVNIVDERSEDWHNFFRRLSTSFCGVMELFWKKWEVYEYFFHTLYICTYTYHYIRHLLPRYIQPQFYLKPDTYYSSHLTPPLSPSRTSPRYRWRKCSSTSTLTSVHAVPEIILSFSMLRLRNFQLRR